MKNYLNFKLEFKSSPSIFKVYAILHFTYLKYCYFSAYIFDVQAFSFIFLAFKSRILKAYSNL